MKLPGAEGYFTSTDGIDFRLTSFEVFEVPRFLPTGRGGHEWALVDKTGRNTLGLVQEFAHQGGVSPRDIGYAGLKDKNARTVQWFSSTGRIPESGRGFRTLIVRKSGRKLRPGNLLGNWFRLSIATEAPESALAVLRELKARGVPNFFGPQRFSRRNHEIGRHLVKGEKSQAVKLMKEQRTPLSRRFFRLMEDAFTSYLFNKVLTTRLSSPGPLEGDITGRFGPTGPVFGYKLPLPSGAPGDTERQVLEEESLGLGDFPGKGRRRALFVPLTGLDYRTGENLEFRFFLPKGSYATAVLREIGKTISSSSS